MKYAVISTWRFSKQAVMYAEQALQNGDNGLDTAEKAIILVENDPDVSSVGFNAYPNEAGEVELDAAVMDGKTLDIGAVISIKGFKNPVSVARKVMEESPHNVLAGIGAEEFALKHGFCRDILICDDMRGKWEKLKAEQKKGRDVLKGHDTVGMVILDTKGRMYTAVSTSGTGMKPRGRVGDSSLVGSGFYVDDDVGGAAATGWGEDIMKGCVCYQTVEYMRQGMEPDEAVREAVKRADKRIQNARNIAVVCADKYGRTGAYSNHAGFEYWVASDKLPGTMFEVVFQL